MQKFDPQMASRVWSRVQACQEKDDRPPATIRVVQTPPEAWKENCTPKVTPYRRQRPCLQMPWLWLALIWVLCCGEIC